MNTMITIRLFFMLSVLTLLLLSGCTSLGIYTESRVQKSFNEFYDRGFEEGRAHEIRAAEHARQEALEKRQSQKHYYRLPVPAHINEDGVKIEAHYVPIKIVTE